MHNSEYFYYSHAASPGNCLVFAGARKVLETVGCAVTVAECSKPAKDLQLAARTVLHLVDDNYWVSASNPTPYRRQSQKAAGGT
jgi:hypothetical protein